MESTCKFSECPVAVKLKLKSADQCPNYIESFWIAQETGEKKLIKDCVNKRMLLMVMDLSNRLVGVEQSQEQQRNVLRPLNDYVKAVMGAPQQEQLTDGL